jgi:hypothetical protein
VTDGSLDHLAINLSPGANHSAGGQYLGLLALVGVCIAAAGLWHWSPMEEFLYRWPHAVAALVGIAYWAFLQPSWLGLLIVAASLMLSFRTGWPGRAIRQDASTVLRASRPK